MIQREHIRRFILYYYRARGVFKQHHENETRETRVRRDREQKDNRCFSFMRKNRSKRPVSGRLGKCHLERSISLSNTIMNRQ